MPEGFTFISLNTVITSFWLTTEYCLLSARRMHIHIIKHSDNIFLAHNRILSAQSVPEGFTFISLNTVITSFWFTTEYCLLSAKKVHIHYSYHWRDSWVLFSDRKCIESACLSLLFLSITFVVPFLVLITMTMCYLNKSLFINVLKVKIHNSCFINIPHLWKRVFHGISNSKFKSMGDTVCDN